MHKKQEERWLQPALLLFLMHVYSIGRMERMV